MFDYIVVGAGFAGSTVAERIANKLKKQVLIIDKRNHIGGNCFDYRNETGIIIHKYGPHLFHTDDKNVVEYLSNFTDWHIYKHKVLALVEGKKIHIPFNFESLEKLFPHHLSIKLQEKLLQYFKYGSRISVLDLKKHNDPDINFLGNFLYEKIYLNYTAKQWGKKPDEISEEVISRVKVIIGKNEGYFDDKYQMVPLNGYSQIFQNMLQNKYIKILLNTDFKEIIKIDIENTKIYFLNQEFKGKLIFTGMIDELFEYRFGKLPYRSLKFHFKTLDQEYFQEVATINYPNNYDFTRITEFKHIHPLQTPKTTIVFEYPEDYEIGKIPYYPVFTQESTNIYQKYLYLSQKFNNLILVGRLAEFKYYDMDDIVKRALEIFEEKIK